MKKAKKILGIILIIGLATAMLGGCGTSSVKSGQSSVKSNNQVTLKYTYWGGSAEKNLTDEQVKKFEASYPNIKIDAQLISSAQYLTKLNTMAASNTLPDVGYFLEPNVLQWSQKGMFLNVQDL